jgi:hypothetical protein
MAKREERPKFSSKPVPDNYPRGSATNFNALDNFEPHEACVPFYTPKKQTGYRKDYIAKYLAFVPPRDPKSSAPLTRQQWSKHFESKDLKYQDSTPSASWTKGKGRKKKGTNPPSGGGH